MVDRHRVHRAKPVKQWLAARPERLRLFLLPAYSPELNPDEYLNQDVKSNALGCQRPRHQAEMLGAIRPTSGATFKPHRCSRSEYHLVGSIDPAGGTVEALALTDKCHHIVNAKECQEIVNAPHAGRGST
jgi:hypothetical protein